MYTLLLRLPLSTRILLRGILLPYPQRIFIETTRPFESDCCDRHGPGRSSDRTPSGRARGRAPGAPGPADAARALVRQACQADGEGRARRDTSRGFKLGRGTAAQRSRSARRRTRRPAGLPPGRVGLSGPPPALGLGATRAYGGRAPPAGPARPPAARAAGLPPPGLLFTHGRNRARGPYSEVGGASDRRATVP